MKYKYNGETFYITVDEYDILFETLGVAQKFKL